MTRVLKLATLAICFAAGHADAADFDSFASEVARFEEAFSCPKAKVIPPDEELGALYSCIVGDAETAKYFINELPKTGHVENIKVMWNDWFKDIGEGLHADKEEAEALLTAAAGLYAPAKEQQLLAAFRSKKDQKITANGFSFAYTYRRGPAIDERLVIIEKP